MVPHLSSALFFVCHQKLLSAGISCCLMETAAKLTGCDSRSDTGNSSEGTNLRRGLFLQGPKKAAEFIYTFMHQPYGFIQDPCNTERMHKRTNQLHDSSSACVLCGSYVHITCMACMEHLGLRYVQS